jgi:hypothetical protein
LWFNVQQQIFHAYSELYKNIKYIEMKAGREIDATIFNCYWKSIEIWKMAISKHVTYHGSRSVV